MEIIREVLGLEASRVREAAWLDAGSGFLGLLVDSAETVMAMEPSIAELGQHLVGVLGPHEPGGPADVELRSFTPSRRIDEPRAAATLSAAFATWLVPRGLMPPSFTVAQGRAVGHVALMTVAVESDATWVGGAVISRSAGTLEA
ncbi:PhzF family phenazine biosynthesis protein [Kocuria palustris]|uniref:PhzF family phenazine biosynthesis protein n=1 Tax=Kocuria palustris TaxID=71999 RepID=UPI0016424C08|nr:PhzF family phenazine biosynthesis protein [Kocuria palustris]